MGAVSPLTLSTENLSNISKYTEDVNSCKKFSRYKLTSKSPVNSSTESPVMRFTFTKVHQGTGGSKFSPGHYIEIQARVKGQVVTRCYTPLEGKLSKSFSLYIKIYPYGLMSQHLNEQLLGYEVQVRGPFDVILDRSGLTHALSDKEESLKKGPPLLGSDSRKKTSLLNPDSSDGCWDVLYMIAGGTGVTPMLQLIRYHLEKVVERGKGSRLQMHLLFGNRRIKDVIDGQLLEELALSSRGMLTVKYCLSEPPPAWGGIRGFIDSTVLIDWMNMIHEKPVQSPVTETTSHPYEQYPEDYQYPESEYRANSPPIPPSSSISDLRRTDNSVSNYSYSQSEDRGIMNSDIISEADETIDLDNLITPSVNNQIFDKERSKIVVCGPYEMMVAVEQTLISMGYSNENFIMLY